MNRKKTPCSLFGLTTLVCAVAFTLFTIPPIYAQVPAGPNRPSTVPEEYVRTPFGYFHPTCVKHLMAGDILRKDEGLIQHADGSFDSMQACSYPHYDSKGKVFANTQAPDKPPTISHSWIVAESVTTSSSFGKLGADWTVPRTPTSNDDQTLYFFPGMEDYSDVISIIQPVLGWNADYIDAWGIASWNCCISGTTYESSPARVNSGDGILGTMQSTCSPGTLTCASWNITTEDVTSGQSTLLSESSSDGQTFNWAFAAALEVYNIVQCSDYPPDGSTTFSNLALYDDNFDQISSPGWLLDNWSSGLTPQCGYGGQGSATQATLNYSTPQAEAPTNSGSYTTFGQDYPTITFTINLYDSTLGAEIYWQVAGCSGSTSGSSPVSSGGSFTLVYQSGSNCNPSGTMYATAPGYAQSATVPIDFP